jgi:TolB-like protein
MTLASPRTISVIARAAIARAQQEGDGLTEISRALSADYLIEGYVRRDGDRVRITAQLIETEHESYLWARTFDCVLVDTLALQMEVADEIAKNVTDALSERKRASA